MRIIKLFSSVNLFGGTPTKIYEICKNSRHDLVVYLYEYFCGDPTFFEKFQQTSRPIIEAYFGKNILSHFLKLRKVIVDYDIKIIHTYFSFGFLLGFIAKKMFPQLHWVVSFVAPDSTRGIKKMVINFILNKVDGVIYISNYVRDAQKENYSSLNGKKDWIIYNGAQKRHIEGHVERKATLELLTVGGLVAWKNTRILLELASKLKHNGIDFRLTVIGDGPERENLQNYTDQNELSKYVDMIGYSKNVGGYLEMCDIYLHPSLTEGFGIAVAEAMHHGKPVIVARAGALVELVEDGVSGIVVSPDNADEWFDFVYKLYEDNQMANRFGMAAAERAQVLFSYDRFVKDHDEIYESFI